MVTFWDLIDSEEDKSRFEQLIKRYEYFAYWVARNRVHNHDLAQECVQETFFVIARHFEKINEIESPATKSFVATVADRMAIKLYNKEHRAVFVHTEDEDTMMALLDPDEIFKTDKISALELSVAIEEALDDEERRLMDLRYVQKFNVSELARMFGTTNYYINKALNGAIEKLRVFYEEE